MRQVRRPRDPDAAATDQGQIRQDGRRDADDAVHVLITRRTTTYIATDGNARDSYGINANRNPNR